MWSAIAGVAGASAGIGASLGSSLLNSGVQYATSKSLAKYNYELGQRSLLNSPSSYKKGLIKAGINPILASNSPVGSTQGSSGVNPNADIAEGAAKGVAAVNSFKQTNSNVELQQKQGDAALMQGEASLLTAKTNAKKAGVEIEGIQSTISLNKAKEITEQALQGKYYSEEMKNNIASLAQWVSSEMDRAQLDYWKKHPDQFDNYMEEKLKSEGNMNSARNWQKWTNAASVLLNVVGKIYDAVGTVKKPSLGVIRTPTKYAAGF